MTTETTKAQDNNIKVQFAEVYNFLEDNKNKKVATILSELGAMMQRASSAPQVTTKYNEAGELTHIFCYYHKEWEDIATTPYGKKANTKTGLNTMCKAGVSNWSKQQRAKKKAEAELLTKLASREIDVDDLERLKAEINEAASVIIPLDTVEAIAE